MKPTRNSKIFAAIGIVITALFFPALTYLIQSAERTGLIAIVATAYGLIWFFSGLLLGKNDTNRDYRGNLGLLYHLITNVIVSVGAIITWIVSDKTLVTDVRYNNMDMVITLGIAWGTYLIHWLAVRNQTKGIDKKEAFK